MNYYNLIITIINKMGTFFSKEDDTHILTRMSIAVSLPLDHLSRYYANIVIMDLKKCKYNLLSI